MIEDLSQYQIRETNSDGALIRSGYIFYEGRHGLQYWRGITMFFAFLFLAIALLCVWIGFYGFGVILGLCMLATLAWVFSLQPQHLIQKRTVIFTADNEILISAYTRPRDPEPPLEVLPVGHDQIASIEAEQSVDGFGKPVEMGPFRIWQVNMYFRDQQHLIVAQDLPHRDTARITATQIAQALQDINDPYWERK